MPRQRWGNVLTQAVAPLAEMIGRRKEYDRRRSLEDEDRERQLQETADSLAQIHGGQPAYYLDRLKAGESPDRIRADAQTAKAEESAGREKRLNEATEVAAMARDQAVGPEGPNPSKFDLDALAKQVSGQPLGPQYGPSLPMPKEDFYGDFQKAYPGLSIDKARADVSLDDMVESAARIDPTKSRESHRKRLIETPDGKRAAIRDYLVKQNPGSSPYDVDQMLSVMEMSGASPTASLLQGPTPAQQKQAAQDELLAKFSDDETYSPKELTDMGLTASESIKYSGMRGAQIKERMLNGEPESGPKGTLLQQQYDIILRNKGLKPGTIEYATEFVKMGAKDEDKQVPSDAVIASTYKSVLQGLLNDGYATEVTPELDSMALNLTRGIVTGMGTAAEKLGGPQVSDAQARSLIERESQIDELIRQVREKLKAHQ